MRGLKLKYKNISSELGLNKRIKAHILALCEVSLGGCHLAWVVKA